jgi:septin family protein
MKINRKNVFIFIIYMKFMKQRILVFGESGIGKTTFIDKIKEIWDAKFYEENDINKLNIGMSQDYQTITKFDLVFWLVYKDDSRERETLMLLMNANHDQNSVVIVPVDERLKRLKLLSRQ